MLLYKPGNCCIGLREAVMKLFLQQAPARNSFKRVCCLRIAHEIAEHLPCEFWFSIDAGSSQRVDLAVSRATVMPSEIFGQLQGIESLVCQSRKIWFGE